MPQLNIERIKIQQYYYNNIHMLKKYFDVEKKID